MAERACRTRRLEALHRTAADLHSVGALDKATMHDLKAFCLTPVQPAAGAGIQKPRSGRASARRF